jgi:hypothetical protein
MGKSVDTLQKYGINKLNLSSSDARKLSRKALGIYLVTISPSIESSSDLTVVCSIMDRLSRNGKTRPRFVNRSNQRL